MSRDQWDTGRLYQRNIHAAVTGLGNRHEGTELKCFGSGDGGRSKLEDLLTWQVKLGRGGGGWGSLGSPVGECGVGGEWCRQARPLCQRRQIYRYQATLMCMTQILLFLYSYAKMRNTNIP